MTAAVVWHRMKELKDTSWARIGGPGLVGPRVTVQVVKARVGWSIWVTSNPASGNPYYYKLSGACTESGARNRGLRIARRYQRQVRDRLARLRVV